MKQTQIQLNEIDFVKHCNEYKAQILAQIGVNGLLPHQIDNMDYMMIKGVDELLEYYFTYKLVVRLYGWEVSEAMEEIGDFVADLLILSKNS